MTPIVFENLTKKEIDFLVSNDCGTSWFNVPDFSFDSACWRHDVGYWVGNTPEDRKIVDLQFYYNMQATIDDMPWYRRLYMRAIPHIYYWAVRAGGAFGNSFNWGKRRYYEDLVYAMTLADHHTNLPEGWDA